MSKCSFIAIFSVAFFAQANVSYAHMGHLGELAGHAHWVGIGAIAVAAALAAAAAKVRKQDNEEDADSVDAGDTEQEEVAA